MLIGIGACIIKQWHSRERKGKVGGGKRRGRGHLLERGDFFEEWH